jgi:nanoRNase/pAp phosphatase (c-di-AMP/oligoRNAs hydrolase)
VGTITICAGNKKGAAKQLRRIGFGFGRALLSKDKLSFTAHRLIKRWAENSQTRVGRAKLVYGSLHIFSIAPGESVAPAAFSVGHETSVHITVLMVASVDADDVACRVGDIYSLTEKIPDNVQPAQVRGGGGDFSFLTAGTDGEQ